MTQVEEKGLGVRPWLVIAFCLLISSPVYTQTVGQTGAKSIDDDFRVEKIAVAGGAELITIFIKRSGVADGKGSTSSELPLLSVVRDTLGDASAENDRMRFVYMLTYTRPSFRQKAAAFVPFLYTRTRNREPAGNDPPPAIADINGPDRRIWNKILWIAFKKILLGELGAGGRSSASQYRENSLEYRRSAVASALTVLSIYQKVEGEKVLSDTELRDIQAKLWLRDETFGSLMQPENLQGVYERRTVDIEDNRGHNWELLRQHSEAQGLYFQPLKMPDGSATHALVWIAREDLALNRDRKFDSRFLNIKDPWSDKSVAKWTGYTQRQWFDEENRLVDAHTPGARSRVMIPLALYALDTKKIPGILIDFRDSRNAKRREMSRRILNDLTGNVLSVSRFSSVAHLLGRSIYDFVTGRRGVDANQASRVRSYAQLKMLLAMDAQLDPALRSELATRIEDVSLNPLQNDLDVEAKIARLQYRNLVDYTRRPDGLAARLERDRREEMVALAHSRKERTFYNLAHVLTLGAYTHREKATPDLIASMSTRRQLEFHERFLNETADRTTRPEIDTDLGQLKRSLAFLSEHGSPAKDKTARSLATIFTSTADYEMRRLCVVALFQIDNRTAKNELLAIYKDPKVSPEWRDLSAQFLKQSVAEGKRISSRTAATVAGMAVN